MVFYHMILSHDFQKSCDKFITPFFTPEARLGTFLKINRYNQTVFFGIAWQFHTLCLT